MKFGHMENGRPVYARLPVTVGGRDYFTEDPAVMLAAGEKAVVEAPCPASRTDGTYTEAWEETDTQLVQSWQLIPHTEEAQRTRYRGLAVRYIHEKYPISDENQILREYLAYGEQCRAAFEEYNAYVEACRARAHREVYGE